MSEEIKAFKIHVSYEELDDLKRRLRATRWPDKETVDDWSQGASIAYLKDVCRYLTEDQVRRRGGRSISPGVPGLAGARVFRQARQERLVTRKNSNSLDRIDAAPWL